MYYQDADLMNCPCLVFEDLTDMIEEHFYVDVPIYVKKLIATTCKITSDCPFVP